MVDVRFLLFTAETEEHLTRATPNEIRQLLANEHATADNPREPDARSAATRHLLIGRTDGGRHLTVVIEATLDPTTWLPVTAWDSTDSERAILART